ncbi:winged helix-turn-helix transcriptional regulator [Halopseudomonas salegens]|uniref:Transcriptional regulator, HxlR family n=1 Tax=Halopseudomonas salegens TaxID=1434072 RepID=A0A1H2HDQ7_9GAMM|nr:helix-turn-helix domain-containing protein [Halopseudomonas salegens]SDU29926.1 transcriptional regulator, HxlR family [Halopseudomonas salegens]
MQRKTLLPSECPIALSLERVGEWWSLLIMRDALQGLRRFDDFSRSLDISPNMLTRRLNALVEAGLLERRAYSDKPLRHEYVPTERGRDLKVVLFALIAWGNKHFAQDDVSVQVIEKTTGKALQPMMVNTETGQAVPWDECKLVDGPGASPGMRERLRGIKV